MFKSLANSEQFPAGVGVAINKEMMVYTKTGWKKNFVTVWDGLFFRCHQDDFSKDGYFNACFPAEVDESSFVRDGVKYVAKVTGNSLCVGCVSQGCPCVEVIQKADKNCIGKIWKRATQSRAMSSVEIAKRYGKGGYAFRYSDKGYFHTVYHNSVSLHGICLIDDLLEDVSRSPWFMPMVDESGNVTEVRCG